MTTPELVVRGFLRGGSGPVQVVVESSGGKAIAIRTVGPTTVGRPANDPAPPFLTRFPISNPRPGGEMTIQVIAYDPDGLPVDVVRRRFVIGAIAVREIGEDGLMGGIVFGGP